MLVTTTNIERKALIMCQYNNNKESKKGKHLNYTERQEIEQWWNRDKLTKVEIARLLERNE